VQAASFDWQKKAAAAQMMGEVPVDYYAKTPNSKLTYWADAGYFADGTSVVKAGNAIFRPPLADPHMNGSPLPASSYQADVGYFVDGSSVVKAGNAIFRPPMPDPHRNGSPLPPSPYMADIGYFANGEPVNMCGNQFFR